MQTIAITIDEATLDLLKTLTQGRKEHRGRSAVVREAIRALAEREIRQQLEQREAEILRRHRTRLARQARALIGEQAQP